MMGVKSVMYFPGGQRSAKLNLSRFPSRGGVPSESEMESNYRVGTVDVIV